MSPSILKHLLLSLIVFTSIAAWGRPPRRVITFLQQDPSVTKKQALQLRQALQRALQEAAYEIHDPRATHQLFKAQGVCVSVECLSRASRQLGVQFVVGGRVDRVAGSPAETWTVALWIFDAQAQATVATAQGGCERCGLQQAIEVIGPTVVELLREARESGASARLNIHSRPEGATVSINGRPMGVTNMSFGVVPGRQKVILRLAGYQPAVVSVEVKPGKEVTIQTTLKTLRLPDTLSLTTTGTERSRVYSHLKWILGSSAALALPLGVIFIAQGKQDSSREGDLAEKTSITNYTPVGIVLIATGGTLAAGALLSLLLEHRAPKTAHLNPKVDASALGITVSLGGRF